MKIICETKILWYTLLYVFYLHMRICETGAWADVDKSVFLVLQKKETIDVKSNHCGLYNEIHRLQVHHDSQLRSPIWTCPQML